MMMKPGKLFLSGCMIMLFASVLAATTFTVDNLIDGDPGSLRDAISDAIADNTATEAAPHIIEFDLPPNSIINLNSIINISGTHINIVGTGMDDLFIDANMNDRIFEIQNSSTIILSDLTIRNGNTGSSGGGLTVETNCKLTTNYVRFVGNRGENGGAIRAGNDSELYVNFSIFESNRAGALGGSGGAINAGGTVNNVTIISNSEFKGNRADDHGGALFFSDGYYEIVNTVISGNLAGDRGGGIYHNERQLSGNIRNTTISGNHAADKGGGIYQDGRTNNLVLGNSIVAKNTASDRGPDLFEERSIESIGGNIIGDNSESAFFIDGVDGNIVGNSENPFDPMFEMMVPSGIPNTGGDLRPNRFSEAINNGLNLLAPPDLPDLGGDERIQNEIVDIGAYETFRSEIPTLSEWGMILLTLSLLIIGTVSHSWIRQTKELESS